MTIHSLVGVVLSHPHLDHYGLIGKVPPTIPIFMGEAASRILREVAFFSPAGVSISPSGFLRHRDGFNVGPFRVVAFLNDHSAFDAYSLLVEADGHRLFYTGDIRGHGRKSGLFEELLRRPPEHVDVLLMEGTHVRSDASGSERGMTELEVENACAKTFASTKGMALAIYSPQNIDRLVSIFKAAVRSGRDLVIDLYTAAVVAATRASTIPQANWDRVRVYVPRSQRAKVIKEQAFDRTDAVRAKRIYSEELAAKRGELAMTFRFSMANELATANCLDNATAIWSMWPGYLRDSSGEAVLAFLEEHEIPLVKHHASGHAFIPDLRRLVDSIAPKRVVPIHSFATERFTEFFPRVDRKTDGAWWDV